MDLTATQWIMIGGFIFTIGTTIVVNIYGKGEWKGTVNATLEKLSQKIEALTKRVDKIYEVFLELGVGKTLESQSPIRLNDLGKEIANELDLDSLADTHTLLIKAKVESLNPYEIQQLCFRYAQEDLVNELAEKSPEQYKAISFAAYKRGIAREDILKIVGVLLRARVLRLMNYSDADMSKKPKPA
ncbi:MAG: hypothetical protein OXI53_12685 [Nitrospira sp.]|nr:hypothetical protein [Nitrospira sp.]MDE0406154.1 hypothetical protein [Nitrospira sp.]MDE0486695.1 hypothetical protein [Nitrospira sp.]